MTLGGAGNTCIKPHPEWFQSRKDIIAQQHVDILILPPIGLFGLIVRSLPVLSSDVSSPILQVEGDNIVYQW